MERMPKLVSVTAVCSGALLLAACATGTVPFEPTKNQEVAEQTHVESVTREITGSRIKRTVDPDNPNANTLSPVSIMDHEELLRHRTLDDAIGSMINMRGGPGRR